TASAPHVAIRRLSALKLRQSTPRGHSTVVETLPFQAFQMTTLPPPSESTPPPATRRPSGLKASVPTPHSWTSGRSRRPPELGDHTRTARSIPPEARRRPSGS